MEQSETFSLDPTIKEKLPYRQSVVGYFFNENGELLIHQPAKWKDGGWRVPGGGCQVNETPEETLQREMREEFGVDIEVLGISKDKDKFEWPDELIKQVISEGKGYRGQEQHQLLGRLTGQIVDTHNQEEIRSYKWVKVSELPNYFKLPNQLENAMKVIEEFNH